MGDPAIERSLSAEHFSVDGTLIDAWASMKSFRRKDGKDEPPTGPGRNAERNFQGETRSNDTHASTTDPDARLYRKSKGQPARLCYMGHLLIENRHGLIVDMRTTHATGPAEHEAAEDMIATKPRTRRCSLGADKAYDTAEHVAQLRTLGVTPHVAQNTAGRRSAIDGRTTRHRGLKRVAWVVTLTATACNLVRLPELSAAAT
jgi:IS5 family transposase